jgi:hypothetical protein
MLVRMGQNDEYAIWKNGDFGPQRHSKQSGGMPRF